MYSVHRAIIMLYYARAIIMTDYPLSLQRRKQQVRSGGWRKGERALNIANLFMIIDRRCELLRYQGSQMQATHKKTEEKREYSLYKTLL